MVATAGVDAGFAQGAVLGMAANLKTMANIISPLLWSRVYAAGVRPAPLAIGGKAIHTPPCISVFLVTLYRKYAGVRGGGCTTRLG